MENKYNIMITYKGDGDFKFVVKRIGEITITKTKPVYIYNVDANVINSLRDLRRLLLEVTIGAKPEGAYKVYNFDDYMDARRVFSRKVADNTETLSNADISSILKGATEPEVVETKEVVEEKAEEVTEEPVKEEAPKQAPKKPSTSKKKSTKKKSNKK